MGQNKEEYYEERKKRPCIGNDTGSHNDFCANSFCAGCNAQPTKQPDNQLGQRDTKAISYKYTKLDQAPMKESVQASSENTPMQWSEGRQIWHLMGMLIQDGIPIITHIKVRIR